MVENPHRHVQWLPLSGLKCAILLEREETNQQNETDSLQYSHTINKPKCLMIIHATYCTGTFRQVCLHNPDIFEMWCWWLKSKLLSINSGACQWNGQCCKRSKAQTQHVEVFIPVPEDRTRSEEASCSCSVTLESQKFNDPFSHSMMTLLRHDYIQLLTIDLVLLSCVTTVLQPSHDNKTHSPAAAKGNLCNWSEKFITHAVAAADLWLDIVPALLNFVVNLLMVISRFKESGKRCWAVVNTFWYTIEPSSFCIMSFKKEPEVTETCGHWQALMIGEARIYKNLVHLGKMWVDGPKIHVPHQINQDKSIWIC